MESLTQTKADEVSDFSLAKLAELKAQLPTQLRQPLAFAMSQDAYDALRAEFEKWPAEFKRPSNIGRTELGGILTEVKVGQEIPCWAFFDLKMFRAYMDPHVPAGDLEVLKTLRSCEH